GALLRAGRRCAGAGDRAGAGSRGGDLAGAAATTPGAATTPSTAGGRCRRATARPAALAPAHRVGGGGGWLDRGRPVAAPDAGRLDRRPAGARSPRLLVPGPGVVAAA